MEFLARQPTTMWCRDDSGLQESVLRKGRKETFHHASITQ